MMDNLILIPIGITIATFASLIGIGGGLLWAPYLILVRNLNPQEAIMISFLIQFVGMGSATFTNIKNKAIYWRLALILLPFVALGVIIGSFINQRLAEPHILEVGLGITCIVVSLYFAFQTEDYNTALNLDRSMKPPWSMKGQSSIFGIVSGLFSIGIGDFLIPVMRGRMKIPMHYTIGTCLFLNFSLAFVGGIFHFVFSDTPLDKDMISLVGYSWVGVIIGGQLGPKLSRMIGDNRLKEMFVFVLLIIGIHLIYQSM